MWDSGCSLHENNQWDKLFPLGDTYKVSSDVLVSSEATQMHNNYCFGFSGLQLYDFGSHLVLSSTLLPAEQLFRKKSCHKPCHLPSIQWDTNLLTI